MTEYNTESFEEDKVSQDFGKQMDGQADGQMERQMDAKTEGYAHKWNNGQIHKQMDGQHIEEETL